MQTLTDIKRLLEEQGLRPNKALGQNFLCDHNLIRRLVDASGVGEGELVLEVGPGTGALTDALLERGCDVVACELDRGLADLIALRHGSAGDRFRLVRGDCLERKSALNPEIERELGGRPFKLVANLPYGAASPLMALLATRYHPAVASTGAKCLGQFVTIQKEVAQRLRAGPGTSDFGELGVIVQAMCAVARLATLAPECFWPRPKVTSEMVSIVPLDAPLTDQPDRLSALCRLLFTKRRKQLGTILSSAGQSAALPAAIPATARPEQLTVAQLVDLSRRMATAAEPG